MSTEISEDMFYERSRYTTGPVHYSPDWLIFGLRMDNGQVSVVASKDLDRASLKAETDFLYRKSDPLLSSPVSRETRYFLTADMGHFLFVHADSYAEGLRKVMDSWNPDEPKAITTE